MNRAAIQIVEAGTGQVTAQGIDFLGKRYTGRTPLRELWFERLHVATNRTVPVYYCPVANELYIRLADDYERLREVPVYSVSEEQRERYFSGFRQLKERWLRTKRQGQRRTSLFI